MSPGIGTQITPLEWRMVKAISARKARVPPGEVASPAAEPGTTAGGRTTSEAPPEQAAPLVEAVAKSLAGSGIPVAGGRFGADMLVESAGDGPVTILLDSARGF